MKCIAIVTLAASILAATPVLAIEVTNRDTGITTSVNHSDYGVSLSNNAVGKMVGNKHVYGFATVGYGSDQEHLGVSQDAPTSPLTNDGVLGMVGISYRF